ncbi:MAG: hypothetical protein GTN97_04410 [Nitrosopumilaceae archaeon]|nr:hypothetical protein [Nitrosopumilaceae archaeon]NIP10282.1 hypothetical protein [Nitrosopumilaceae archaeon]NIS95145.1 hypothetical protein [Nitrosopumilaceae archaeon]
MPETQLNGSGGYIVADISEELTKKADLGVGKLFLAPIGKLPEESMKKHFCKNCDEEFPSPPTIHLEENPDEEVADNLILIERGQYTCQKCNFTIGEYRVFEKKDESKDIGTANPNSP